MADAVSALVGRAGLKPNFEAATVADAQAAIRTLGANRCELWDSYGDPADFPHNPAG